MSDSPKKTIDVHISFEASDIQTAMALAIRKQRLFRVIQLLMVIVMALILVLAVLHFLTGLTPIDSELDQLAIYMILAVLLVYSLIRWGMPWWYGRTAIRGQPGFQGQQLWCFHDTGVSVKSDHSDAETKWSLYVGWIENPSVFLLYLSTQMFHLIPKRCLVEGQEAPLRELLTQHIGEPRT